MRCREVFAVPGGCTLVRADLFRALGGFDPEMPLFGEDVDLCWRAQVAGARVVVAPAARVRHLQLAKSGTRPVGDAALLRRRHELRSVLKNYDPPGVACSSPSTWPPDRSSRPCSRCQG